MSMAEYYQDQEMEAMANLDNEVARLEKEAQAKAFEKRTKEIIQQQMVIIKSEIIAARDKEWVANLNDEFTVIRLTDELDDVAEGDYVVMSVKRWNELKEKANG